MPTTPSSRKPQSIARIEAADDLRGSTLDRLTPATRAAVEHASIILVPQEGFRDHTGPVFPQGTTEFLQFLREHAPDTPVEIAIEDKDYHELALHFDVITLATLFVQYIAAPATAGLIAAYLKDRLGSRFNKTEVRTTIVVKQKEGAAERALRISYEGPASTFEKSVADAIAGLNAPAPRVASPKPAMLPPATDSPPPLQTKRRPKKRRR